MTRRCDVPSARESHDAPGSTLGERAAHALLAYREGRTDRLDAVVRETTPLLWATVRAQGVGHDEAADIVQNTWVQLVKHADRIEEPRAVLKWLLTTARRAAWDAVRNGRADAALRTDLPEDETRHAALPDATPSPDAQVLAKERDRILWAAFAKLSERCRELLHLVSLADRPDYRMISAAVGMPVGSIGATRGRCLAKLRTELDRMGGGAWI
ncbi:RNA polymerase sigma factor [Myceligenerans pegani]|uniref:Sigma-70 family RNA polymerase sigma factor n=1 Tax=Myceligenerans pegani TaxID=2776917 RepID=A0ABR9MSB6_9MICO|nr:sigma-70 family RNA polymerase sigma factor [Myceligenerans sp. TRM 65318]MBE1874262.1 sigma-70 family RNA polymerase sigma factor [Myceligenerans sp. TRM 65318]MBE3016533.1 sigma-70 family RNA polymerase sigma factor [Myceligenerans sp. TRM 65318]